MKCNPWLKASAALTAVLAVALLAGVGTGRAATSFLLFATIDSIDKGDVDAAGKSGRFVVRDRHVGGTLGGVIGDQQLTTVPFEFTFGTNVPLMTQSGNLHGVLEFAGLEAKVAAKTQLGLSSIPCDPATIPGCVPLPGGGGVVPQLLLSGTLTFIRGTTGHGTIEGFLVPTRFDADGHITDAFGQVTLGSS